MIKTPPIIVILTIGNEQITVTLVQKKESWSIYDILVNNQIHGQVQKAGNRWAVITHQDSPIQEQHYSALGNAIDNFIEYRINHNS